MIERTVHVGERVWVASADWSKTLVPCPVCYGTKQVTLILGNGERQPILCNYCTTGAGSEPTGTKDSWDFVPTAEEITIGRVVQTELASGKFIYEYHYGVTSNSWSTLRPDQMFWTKEEAYSHAAALSDTARENRDAEEYRRVVEQKSHIPWNVGYHLTSLVMASEQADRIERHLARVNLNVQQDKVSAATKKKKEKQIR